MQHHAAPLLTPLQQEIPSIHDRYKVVIFNNDHTPVDLVVRILMEATGCDVQEACLETWEAHHFGCAPVHFAGEPACHAVAAIINTIGVKTEVSKEWNE